MSDSVDADIAYKCDVCGEIFTSPAEVQSHSREAHADNMQKGEFESEIPRTSTPAEDREEESTK
jgi:hypothetical protein